MNSPQRTALITGGNRGIGLEFARLWIALGHRIYLTARNLSQAEQAAVSLGPLALPVALDVTQADSITRLATDLNEQESHLDLLINNAGIYPALDANPLTVPLEEVQQAWLTHVHGPLQLIRELTPLLAASPHPACVINVSSGLGSFALCAGPDAEFHDYIGTSYGTTKAALNMMTVCCARHFEKNGSPVRINAVSPGWCRTDMGGAQAPRSAEDGARTLLRYALLSRNGPSGAFLGADGVIPW